jgi:hypothetical protein
VNCGEAVIVKDWNGTYVRRFIADCHGRFILISHGLEPANGFILADWQAVLRELVALAVPEKLREKALTAESQGTGMYWSVFLTYPLSVRGLCGVLGASEDELRASLSDLAVQVTG